jgi:hypothetical protein
MWEPQRLTTLWAFTAWYRDSFTFFHLLLHYNIYTPVDGVIHKRKRKQEGSERWGTERMEDNKKNRRRIRVQEN